MRSCESPITGGTAVALKNNALQYKAIERCRVCKSPSLIDLFSLGLHCVNDFPESPEANVVKCPIRIVMCDTCSLVQQKYTAPQSLLYSGHYWYRSGVTSTMRRALADIVEAASKTVKLRKDDVVLDIGSNDGTLLRNYPAKVDTIGVEPAQNLWEQGSAGVDLLINDFWNYGIYDDKVGRKAKIITAIGMFYDLDDPNEFIADVAMALHEEGIFIAQLMCVRDMLLARDVGNLCHEHLEFYSLKALRYLYEENGLEIIDIERNRINGGSYRIYARLNGSKVTRPHPARS